MVDATLTKIGQVTVRSGHIIIADPADMRDGLSYEAVMHVIDGGGGQVDDTGAVAFYAGQANGKYPVFADIDEEGRIVSVMIDFQADPRRELPIVSVEHFGALNLLAHNYGVLAGLIANYSSVELDDLVKNGYRTKGESE